MATQDKFRVDIKQVTDAILRLQGTLADGIQKQRITKAQVQKVESTLDNCYRQLKSVCCDSQFFCDF